MAEPTTNSPWEPLPFEHDGEDGAVEIPLKLLVIAPLGDRLMDAPMRITSESFDEVMTEYGVTLDSAVANHLLSAPEGGIAVALRFSALADFGPDALLRAIPELRDATVLIEVLRGLAEAEQSDWSQLPQGQATLMADLHPPDAPDPDWLRAAVAELTERLGNQLDAILHDPEFQRLESAWRSLAYLVACADDRADCVVDFVAMDKEALREDFAGAASIDETLLFNTLYVQEFGQFGGEPYAAVVTDFIFEPNTADVALMRQITRVAGTAHAPFLAAAGPEFFGVKNFDDLPGSGRLADVLAGPRFAKWRGFTDEEQARYIALTAPRFLLRQPYDYRRGDVTGLNYREDVTLRTSDCLWGSAAFPFAGCLIRSFQRYRACVDIVGPEGGRAPALTRQQLTPGSEDIFPVEVMLSERKEADLAKHGFIPLVADRAEGEMGFYSANSVHWGALADARSVEEIGAHLGAQLPYLFLVSRIAHYLKVVQRDNIGTTKSRAELEAELNAYLRTYVSDVENPAPGVRARRPLRRAQLTVLDPQPGDAWYQMRLEVVPHMKYLGSEFALAVEGRLGQG